MKFPCKKVIKDGIFSRFMAIISPSKVAIYCPFCENLEKCENNPYSPEEEKSPKK